MANFFPAIVSGLVFLIVCVQQEITANVPVPSDRKDVMGEYTVTNKEQCRRLCWYRLLCRSFSYNMDAGNGNNCILHADISSITQANAQIPSDWAEQPASGDDLVNGCAPRPCSATEVCVPAISPNGEAAPHYKCLPLPAICQLGPNIMNADVSVAVGIQDAMTNVECNQGYVGVPKGVSTEIRCQVTSRWTTFSGTCEQAEFVYPATTGFLGIPWPVTNGWEMCVKGTFLANGHININFRPRPDYSEIYLQFSFRYNYNGETGSIWNTLLNGVWGNAEPLGDMPVAAGDRFVASLNITNDQMNIVFHSHNNASLSLTLVPGGLPDVSDSKWVNIGPAENSYISYVNTVAKC